ncbi:helix-turn-helix domain-containing protein [Streptomyces sp. WI04-05B]|uniref:helix-turn-helix domain-containing protein n=1 Tax=Streptomyces TaxID=1883 RepID=UPI0029A548AF|nr:MULTISPECIES: helix-turn-helix transcriptional regulator [unclassified Streptomyces]MDX2540492.1 helix-turn-helix transcriptional regulator [Streptomyces sp. WI04-05B]MDX2585075.1 helix-turn-helix transcriptional regulator [Streptomyces sp. WI04-05A]MDX3749344.1 helix-turn-helix transcriptional regulator [Streptomyces sp. AK08-02]
MTEGTRGNTGGEPESSASLRTFGAVVQALREHHGMSRKELGRVIGYSEHTVASVELGRRLADPEFVDRADKVLGNTGALRKAAEFVNRQPGLAAWFRRWALLEAKAISLYSYECRMLPGLLQTEAYARQLFVDELPPLTDEEIEANWIARAKRQKLLHERPNTAFGFLLEEHLFRRCTGGVDVTRELIDHVLQIARLRNVEIQVMPLVRESHAGLHGPMRLLETQENNWYAYTEAPETGQLISDPKVISVLQQRYARMRAQALTLEDSLSLLERMRGEL